MKVGGSDVSNSFTDVSQDVDCKPQGNDRADILE